ncbi:hypothetical protein FHS83_001533 [Rhizomicrobium palustre]|uniref:Glycosyltransferase RgtA/B/C/D-like domain-containing protein n=1 Tax=Rhizomicrobium palustre TaxID=189966 RepID=A0A846MYD4_9PROT|nr:hypothetical protein [Rhizomicrobium palustre]NIK88215.1 hypothetical protein [Rhizomicrobium palustre]
MARRIHLLVAFIAFMAALVLQAPGHVPYDGIVVWHEAETGKLYAQHPAALVLIWRLCEYLVKGPLLFTALQLATLFLAAALIVEKTAAPLSRAIILYGALVIFPPFLATSGVTVKDVFGAHLALFAFALALHAKTRTLWVAAFAAACLAFLMRYQLGLMLAVLGFFLWRQKVDRASHIVAAICGVALVFVGVRLGVMTLFVQSGPSDIEQSLRKVAVFDIAGISVRRPEADLSALAPKDAGLKAMIARDYSPVRVDTLWQGQKGGGTITAQSGVFGLLWQVPDHTIFATWKLLLLQYPGGFLAHRNQAFARVLGFGDLYQCRPITAGISWLPKVEAAAVGAKAFANPPVTAVLTSRIFPAGLFLRAFLYVMVLAGIALWRPSPEITALCLFALAYEASFYLLPQACEVRYSYPVMLSATAALWLTLARHVTREVEQGGRRKLRNPLYL